jgi:hypothetical protein
MLPRLTSVIALLGINVLAAQQPALKVLFIGNSLTAANGLAAMVEELARAAGGPEIEISTIARGGFSLEDHWSEGDARRALAAGKWWMIVLQQGPSSQPDSQRLLREYVARFDREAKQHTVKVGVYMVWPPRSGPGTFEQVRASYARAALEVDGLLLPVGDAFQAALTHDSRLPLLGADGFHPTPLGTLLAAVVIHQQLSGRPEPFVPLALESRSRAFERIEITAPVRDTLRAAAARAIAGTR